MKSRSYSSVLRAGLGLYTGQFRRIFRSTWVTALVYSLLCGAAGTASLIYWPSLISKILQHLPTAVDFEQEYMQLLCTICTLVLLAFLGNIVFYAYGYQLLKQHQQTGSIPTRPRMFHWEGRMIWRTFKMTCCHMLLGGIAYGLVAAFIYYRRDMLTAPQDHIVPLVTALILLITMSSALLPTLYTSTKYLMSDNTGFWTTLLRNYQFGFFRWGYIFVIVVATLLLLTLFSCVMDIPQFIISQANWAARMGVVGGDPLGMPSYMTALTFATSAVTAFIQSYIWLTACFVLYYMYGAIDQREAEKQQAKNKYNV